uniref:Serpentine receptor class gamma n=1 Tax=Caenorhabditis tropicalis TaxID=1561998 RepID=A0A1I7TY41_9PELO
MLFVLPDETTDSYLRTTIRKEYGVEISSVPYFAILAYNEDGDQKTIRWNSVYCLTTVTSVMLFHYGIMIYCGVFMYRRTVLNLGKISNSYERLQKQFFYVLLYQTAAPTLFFHFPVFIVLFAPFFDFKFNFNSSFVVYGFSAYPLVDSLIVLNVVTEYKFAYRRFLTELLD